MFNSCWTNCCTGGRKESSKKGAFLETRRTSGGEYDDDEEDIAAATNQRRIREVENQIQYTSLTRKAAAEAAQREISNTDDSISNSNRRNSNGRATIFNSPLDVTMLDEFVVDCVNSASHTVSKTKAQREFLHSVLQDNFIFTDFTEADRDLFISALQFEKVQAWERSSWFKSFTTSVTASISSSALSTSSSIASASASSATTSDKDAATIIRQGDTGDYFYIVQKGHVEFERDGVVVGTCAAGGVFGELALLYDCPRAASCIAIANPRNSFSSRSASRTHSSQSVPSNNDNSQVVEDEDDGYCHLWKMDRLTFRHLLARQAKNRDKDMQGVLYSIPIFKDLDSATITRFANSMMTVPFKAGDRIVQKGQTGNVFYIIEQGQVKIHDIGLGDSKLQDQILGPGDWFGERALLTGEVRAANATAVSDSVVTLAMDRETFENTIGPLRNFVDAEMRKHFLQAIPLFAKNINKGGHITEPEFQQLVKLMTNKCYNKGECLATAGEVRENDLWIIQTGQLLVTTHKPPALLSVDSSEYTKPSLESSSSSASKSSSSSKKTSPFRRFSKSSPTRRSASISSSTNSSTTLTLKSGDYFFGDEATLKEGLLSAHAAESAGSTHCCTKCISTLDAVCGEALTTWVLTLADIEAVLGDLNRLAGIVAAGPPARARAITTTDPKPMLPPPPPPPPPPTSPRSPYIPPKKASIEHSNTKIPLDRLEKHRVLGHGAFGKVWLVSYQPIGMATIGKEETYALKVLSKHKLLKMQQHHSVIRERDMLSLLQHPFILQLVSSYQDDNNLYLLLPLIHGGELFNLLHKQKIKGRGLDNEKAAFYSACVIEAIGHFHQRLIAYRDLKLENILIDKDGYCKVCDLGFAKVVVDKTFTLVGTPEYLAPEVIMSKGYSMAVDYWSFGVLCFELHMGVSPFYKRQSTQIEMFKRIILGKYKLPEHTSPTCNEFIQGLLTRSPMRRLGNMSRGYLDIKNHAWYEESGINFTEILRKEFEPPWKPVVKNPLELSDFDNFESLENDSTPGIPLSKKEQEIFAEFGKV